MGIPLGLSALTTSLADNLVLDSGVAYKNLNLSLLRAGGATAFSDSIDPANSWTDPNGDTVAPLHLGAFRAGATFALNKSGHNVDAAGKYGNVKGLQRVDSVAPTLQLTLLEVADVATLRDMLGSSDTDAWSGYQELTPGLVVDEDDYIGNIALCASVSGAQDYPMVIVIENALATEMGNITTAHANEAAVQVTFSGNYLLSSPTSPPVHFFVPTSTGSGSGS